MTGRDDKLPSVLVLAQDGRTAPLRTLDEPSLFSGLHCASFFGIADIVAGLAEMKSCDINQTDFSGSTPLHWAAWNGRKGVMMTLFGRGGVSPDKRDNYGRTPLYHATRRGFEGAVKILPGRDGVSPDTLDNSGRTPLWWTARNGHGENTARTRRRQLRQTR